MDHPAPAALLRAVDCVRLSVPELAAGLAYYRDRLGLASWRRYGR